MRRIIILPALLIAAGVYLLVGCLYIPSADKPLDRFAPTDQVGDARSNKPLRVDAATRADIESTLGLPFRATMDGRQVAYIFPVISGYWVYPLCFQSDRSVSSRALVMTYDGDSILRGFRVEKKPERLYGPMPDEPRARYARQQILEQRQRALQNLKLPTATTTTTTR